MDGKRLMSQAKPYYSEEHLRLLKSAIEFAVDRHSGQKRDSGEDFITHPLSVAAILIDWRLDIDSIVAGVLHDTVEDTKTDIQEIAATFNDDVAFLVDGVTQVSQARSGMQPLDSYLPQTSDNLSKFLIALSHDLRVLIIKLADRLHNLRTLEHISKPRQKKVAKESLEVFAPLADRIGMSRVKVEIEDLAFSYLRPADYQKLRQLIKKRVGRSHAKLQAVEREVANELKKQAIDFTIKGRVKSVYSLHKKLQKRSIDEIYDLMALRIIVDDKKTCYQVLGQLHAMYQPLISKIKDYIAVPKPNGYQSLHTTVLTPSKQIIEFQIRTQAMHDYAERGLAAGFYYDQQKLSKNYTRRRQTSHLPASLAWVRELQEAATKIQGGTIPEGGLEVDIFSDRIFVYSPKGDIYDLPEGATALDFAYAVHSDIGDKAYTAEVNGIVAKLSAPLANGDIVHIKTRGSARPNKDWLNHVQTAKARQKIKSRLSSLNQ